MQWRGHPSRPCSYAAAERACSHLQEELQLSAATLIHACTGHFSGCLHTKRAGHLHVSTTSTYANAVSLCFHPWDVLPKCLQTKQSASTRRGSHACFHRCGNKMHVPQGHSEIREEQLRTHPAACWPHRVSQKSFLLSANSSATFWKTPCSPLPVSALVLGPLYHSTLILLRRCHSWACFPKD